MDLILVLKAVLMGIVEGLTEFLPISSTGHLILVGDLLNFSSERGKMFEIVIQSGAMLAIIWEYRARFMKALTHALTDQNAQRFLANLAIAFAPAALVGLAFGTYIKARLFSPIPVALAFIVGGFIILLAEKRKHHTRVEHVGEMTWADALKVGCAQCLALIPGTSRSGATIVGGLLFGLSRRAATEFSFFLAVPTLMAAGAYQLYKGRALLSGMDSAWFGAGSVAAFISAILCVRWLLRYIESHDFTAFAWYRIVFGIAVVITAFTGVVNWTVP